MLSKLYKKILVIGGNTAGLAAASQARRENPEAEITVLESGEYVSYGSCGLPYYISGIIGDLNSLFAYPASYFEEKRKIRILKNHKAVSIQTFKKEVTANIMPENIISGSLDDLPASKNKTLGTVSIEYDRLIICSGASPVKPDVPGINSKGVFCLRDVKDTLVLKKFIEKQNPKQAVIIGAGSVGLLLAEALAAIGIQVTIVETQNRVFAGYEEEISIIFRDRLSSAGIKLLTSNKVTSINYSSDSGKTFSVTAIPTDTFTGEKVEIEAQLVIVAVGIAPNTGFVEPGSVEINKNKAIKVNQKQQTSHTNIFAAGDCCLIKNLVTGSWEYIPNAGNAIKAGRVAGANAAGADEVFEGSVATKVDKVFGLEIAASGISLKEAIDYRFNAFKITDNFSSHVKYLPGSENITMTLIIDINTRRILGAQMIGREGVGKRLDIFAGAITNELTIDKAYMLDLSYTPWISTAPDAVTRMCGKAISVLKSKRF